MNRDEQDHLVDAFRYAMMFRNAKPTKQRVQWGIIFRPGSLWIGVHWSAVNKRFCINVIPCVTLWITLKGGNVPNGYN